MLNFFIGDFKTTLPIEDDKKMSKLILAFAEYGNLSPSDIQTIVNNAKVQAVIKAGSILSQEELLIQLFDFKNHDNSSVESLVKYLNEKKISQSSISEKLGMSMRQIKNILNKED